MENEVEEKKQRYAIRLSYNGFGYAGWQVQPHMMSVQEKIQLVLTRLHSNQKVSITGCGRTDAGVHAKSYIAHFDSHFDWEDSSWKHKLNRMLPADIVVHNVHKVSPDFHARFDAVLRSYRYFIHQEPDPFALHSVLVQSELDLEKMNQAACLLFGDHDFTSFSKLNTQVNNNRCFVKSAVWKQDGSTIYFEVSANRFLRNMVRALVGTLLEVGFSKMSLEQFKQILEAQDRDKAGMSAPANGLFFWNVIYPDDLLKMNEF